MFAMMERGRKEVDEEIVRWKIIKWVVSQEETDDEKENKMVKNCCVGH